MNPRITLLVLLLAACKLLCAGDYTPGQGFATRSDNDDFGIKLSARIDLDQLGSHDDVTDLSEGGDVRRARLTLSGRAFRDWRYYAEYDFSGSAPQAQGVWLAYTGWRHARLTIGRNQMPFGMERTSSSRNIRFLERALPTAFALSYQGGVNYRRWGDHWMWSTGMYNTQCCSGHVAADNAQVVAGRLVRSFTLGKRNTLHLGLAGQWRNPRDQLRFRTRPESSQARRRLVDTRKLRGVDHALGVGLEAAWLAGPLALQSEYMRFKVARTAPSNPHFGGGYISVGWLFGGEHYRYQSSRGLIRGVRPRGDLGTLELSARFSTIDLQDSPVLGGKERNWTLGLNWIPHPALRLMLNYTRANAHPNRNGLSDRPRLLQLRAQLFF